MAARADLGLRSGDRRPRVALDGLRAVRSVSRVAHHHRPYGRRAALQHVAYRPPQRLGENAATIQGEKEDLRVLQSAFLSDHVWKFRTQTLIDALLEVGADRILFSADWPFENVDHAAQWFDSATISEGDRKKIGRENALRLFKLADKSALQSGKVAQAAE